MDKPSYLLTQPIRRKPFFCNINVLNLLKIACDGSLTQSTWEANLSEKESLLYYLIVLNLKKTYPNSGTY